MQLVLIILGAIVLLALLGFVIGFIVTVLKWLLVIGAVVVVVGLVSGRKGRKSIER